ncbi:MAG TPA: transglycosylase SLT domain-containing protein [Pyrinomonadaceae bacterium]|nr:transglycosylase SLT domain-containing protein [Pyrinomonadaceae bacterium]
MLRFGTHITLVLLFSCLSAVGTEARATRTEPLSNNSASGQNASPPAHRIIRARAGDTLKKIAQRRGVPVAELIRLNRLSENAQLKKGRKIQVPVESQSSSSRAGEVVGNRITLSDGYSFEADEVWKDGDEIWFRKGTISQRLQQPVSSVEPIVKANESKPGTGQMETVVAPTAEVAPAAIWIHLVGGARFRVDEVQDTTDGAWYTRSNLSIFVERERIARIEREAPGSVPRGRRNTDWTSGNPRIDELIRTNGERYSLDPYLIFLVIEQESQFRQRAVSPKGARGLMQLMPATARRLGVRDSFDPAQNIRGGSHYLKELMTMFGGRVDLVLASYNAGEGAVMKYGRAIPPYRETRDYVKRIIRRYGQENSNQK